MAILSRYNHIQSWGDQYFIVYNAFTGAVALLDRENREVYEKVVEKLKAAPDPELNPKEQEIIRQMEYAGFVHPDHYSQREELKFLHNFARYGNAALGFVIAPTMACNMACEYCFEGNKKGRMSDETIKNVEAFVSGNADRIGRL
ncbi:MAG: hypothetical protein AB1746_12095, partial [Candidatus Zixiibacteriota bacterium]